MKRIRCVFHTESTPSLVIYEKGFKCYGCNRTGPHSELPADLRPKEGEIEYEEPEDVEKTFQYIDTLHRSRIRGLDFPRDERGYFVCWPDRSYYKYRLFDNPSAKYIGPRGRKPPLFWARKTFSDSLYLAEGEINALSISRVLPSVSVASPGSATNFNSSNLTRYLTQFKNYSKVVLILDEDKAGIKGLIEAKAFFFGKIPFLDSILLSPDANEILVTHGPEMLKEKLQRNYRG